MLNIPINANKALDGSLAQKNEDIVNADKRIHAQSVRVITLNIAGANRQATKKMSKKVKKRYSEIG